VARRCMTPLHRSAPRFFLSQHRHFPHSRSFLPPTEGMKCARGSSFIIDESVCRIYVFFPHNFGPILASEWIPKSRYFLFPPLDAGNNHTIVVWQTSCSAFFTSSSPHPPVIVISRAFRAELYTQRKTFPSLIMQRSFFVPISWFPSSSSLDMR